MKNHCLKSIFNTFKDHFVELCGNRSQFERYIVCDDAVSKETLFTRQRVWDFMRTTRAILSCFKKSLSVEVAYFLERDSMPQTTPEAYIKRRQLISPDLFRDLNVSLLGMAQGSNILSRWRQGTYLCGIDGTRVSLPYTPPLYGKYRGRPDKGHNLARGVLVTDLINRTIVVADLVPNRTEERKAAIRALEETAFPYPMSRTVFVMDRGYPSLRLMNWFKANSAGFIIKARRDTSPLVARFISSGMLSERVTLKLSENRRSIDYPMPAPMDVRLIKLPNPSKQEEPAVLVTNLDEARFPDRSIRRAYTLRWNTETEIGITKNELQIEIFSGIKDICIRQDFFAAIILYNFESLMRIPCNEELRRNQGSRKYQLQVDMNCTWEITLGMMWMIFKPPEKFDRALTQTLNLFKRLTSIIRYGRHSPRIRRVIKHSGKYITFTNYKRGL